MSRLLKYLDTKPLYYDHIDYGRMPRIYRAVSHEFHLPKTVHVAGTNGKGTTGRFLAQILESAGLKVGHYTSPHILEFNERFYKNGAYMEYDELDRLHERLLTILQEYERELSYFEYATFLAFLAYEDCDYMILEAGVGGEFDATNVAPKELSVITPISLDHQELLGQTIKEIAYTKLQSVNNPAVIAPQEFSETVEIIKQREAILGLEFIYVQKNEHESSVEKYAALHSLPLFLKDNLTTAMRAAEKLDIDIDLEKVKKLNLKARCEKIAPNITIDVGHNAGAAKVIAEIFKGKKIVFVYNSYKDKDYNSVLEILAPIIKRVEIIEIKNPYRADAKQEIRATLINMGITVKDFSGINTNDDYLVFGSFGVVNTFLGYFNEK
ncbi:MAG: bifunctional folylpolyglutamate synthase/dihydrofolate synthase [Campylobacteraceae bacterium]|jgi:dihydrofolate synthase/folylpolyglutamate synthase|nr:bifunctional folylpolyglutamate synthase/dihydrofolate synthase [Campylobacteraceae bacterium]